MQPAEIGHNNPPSDKELIAQQMKERHADLLQEADNLSTIQAISVSNEADIATAADQIKAINNIAKKLETIRKDEKEPYLRKGQIIDFFFNDYRDALSAVKSSIQKPMDEYQKKKLQKEREEAEERARKAREEAESKQALAELLSEVGQTEAAETLTIEAEKDNGAAEAAEAVLTAKTTDMTRVRGDNSTVSLRTSWVGEVTDIQKVDLEKLRPYLTPDAIQKALNGFVRAGGRECAGTSITQQAKSVVR